MYVPTIDLTNNNHRLHMEQEHNTQQGENKDQGRFIRMPVFYSKKSEPKRDAYNHLCLKTPLEPHSDELYKFYATSTLKEDDNSNLKYERDKIRHCLSVCHVLVAILRDLRNQTLRWGKEVVADVWISDDIMVQIQESLLSYIAEIEMSAGLGVYSEPIMVEAIKVRWLDALTSLPDRHKVDYEEDRFSEESFNEIAEGIEKCYSVSEQLFELSNDYLVREFMKTVKDLPVKQNNALYRAVYDSLEFFGWIPEEVLQSHRNYIEKGMNKYVKENYIKSKFKNLKDEEHDWNDMLVAVIDPDWYDPRK